MKYAVIAAMGIAGSAIAAPVQPQGEQGQGNGQDNGQGGPGYGNPDPTSTVPAWETTTPAWETTTPAWETPTGTPSWPTSMPWGTPGPSGYPGGGGGGWPTGWPTGWPGWPTPGWPTPGWPRPTSSVSIPPAATSNPALPICPDVNRLPNADLAPIECINLPNEPEANPGGPIEPLDGNTGPKRRSILDWFKGNNEDNEDNKDN
ncbi:hypothetical protein N7474_007859 [Penicillium riverlandense]|uniref:uncharacterized protein n=1 Tax=Penicillium riverlandense TaxID=1903569 RepID=UPI002548537D|nr:uncharacterized protein N7474_007859 [Penicillium riverlandense]KAJ5811558.1 hypothetical protein N7474_007859 [Penicillium riverlandense]